MGALLSPYEGPGTLDDGHFSSLDLELGDTNNLRVFLLDLQRRLNQVMRGLDTTHAERHAADGSDPLAALAPADHAHAGVSGDGGTFDAANLTSAAAGDGTVLTADGSGGAAWEAIPAAVLAFTPLTTPLTSTSWDGDTKTSANDGTLDLSVVFSAPAGIKAVLLGVEAVHNAGNDLLQIGPANNQWAMQLRTLVINVATHDNGIVPCDANGDICIKVTGTVLTDIKIWGYWL
jgi:hypothetical protein